MNEFTKVWVTKYALTEGIKEVLGKSVDGGKYFSSKRHGFFRRKEFYQSRSEAVSDAEVRRVKKIASLRRQIARLEAMRFDQCAPGPGDEEKSSE